MAAITEQPTRISERHTTHQVNHSAEPGKRSKKADTGASFRERGVSTLVGDGVFIIVPNVSQGPLTLIISSLSHASSSSSCQHQRRPYPLLPYLTVSSRETYANNMSDTTDKAAAIAQLRALAGPSLDADGARAVLEAVNYNVQVQYIHIHVPPFTFGPIHTPFTSVPPHLSASIDPGCAMCVWGREMRDEDAADTPFRSL